ncbi:MAG TPA: hypothetical protein HA348_03355, partial [Thermoplasmata archaeon]|nr:hypothetical protein [Thermoplasmata archaeon]
CFQFGWSSALLEEIALHRYQSLREITPDDFEFKGWVKQAHVFGERDEKLFYSVDTGEYEVPLVEVKTRDDKPLLESNDMLIRFTDTFDNLKNKNSTATIKGISFEIRLDHEYELKDGKIKDLTQQSEVREEILLISIVGIAVVVIILVSIWTSWIAILVKALLKKEKKEKK